MLQLENVDYRGLRTRGIEILSAINSARANDDWLRWPLSLEYGDTEGDGGRRGGEARASNV